MMSQNDNDDVFVKGDDGTGEGKKIGATASGRLKVDIVGGLSIIPSTPSTIVYEDMNATTGGVARDTFISSSFVDIYSYTGSGSFYGFNATFETPDQWFLRLVVDGNDVLMGSTGISTAELEDVALYNIKKGEGPTRPPVLGIARDANSFIFQLPNPITFTTSISVKAKSVASKRFRAGFVTRG